MLNLRWAPVYLLLQLPFLAFPQKKNEMTVIFDVTAAPDSTLRHVGIQIVTDDVRENKVRGKRTARSIEPEEWRTVEMKLARSAFEGRTVTIEAITDPSECMGSYRRTGVVLVDGHHYTIDLLRDQERWNARMTRANLMFAFPRRSASDPCPAEMRVHSMDVNVFQTDVETIMADSALIAYDITSDCTVEELEVLVPFVQLRSPLAEQFREGFQASLKKWNTECIPVKNAHQWIHWDQR